MMLRWWRLAIGARARAKALRRGVFVPFSLESDPEALGIEDLERAAIRALIDAGFEADSVIKSVRSRHFENLRHTGLFSVQLQPPPQLDSPIPEE